MKRTIALTTLAVITTLPAYAGTATKHETPSGYDIRTSSEDSGSHNEQNNNTRQENVGVVNQSAIYSVGQASTYSIDSVVCPTPAFVVSGSTSGGSSFNSTYAISGSVVVPLGGREGKACETAIEARATHYSVQNEVNIARECSALLSEGIVLSKERFPSLARMCEGVSVGQNQEATSVTLSPTTPVTQPIVLPPVDVKQPEPHPVQPVRGLW